MTKYYKPDVKKPFDLTIPKDEIIDSPLTRILGKSKTIKTSIDIDVAIDRFADGIYSGYKSGLRELYNNEARACRSCMALGDPEIHITIDPNERMFIIEGRDSLGITTDVFNKSLTVMGITSNNKSDEIGQMGMGFASYTTLSESIKVDTYARESDENYSFMAENGKKFDPLPNPKMKKFGTKISGTFYDINPRTQERIDIDDMISHIHKLSRYSKIPTYIHLTEDTNEFNSGTTQCQQYDTPMDYLMEEFESETDSRNNKELVYTKKVEVIGDDYEFFGVIGIEKTNWGNTYSYNMNDLDNKITLIGTPIEEDSGYDQDRNMIDRGFSGWVLDIKNERKYKPTADRDRMVKGAMQTIYKEIIAELHNKFQYLKLEDIPDYKSRKDKIPYTSSMWSMVNDFVDDQTTESIVNTLKTHYTTPDKHWSSHNDMITKKNEYKAKGKQWEIIALGSLRRDMMAKLDGVFGDNRIYFRLPTSDDHTERANRIHVLTQLGITIGETYARSHKLRGINSNRKKGEVADRSCRVWGGYNSKGYFKPNYWKKHKSFMLSEINTAVESKAFTNTSDTTKNLVKVSSNRWANALDNIDRTVFCIVKERKGFSSKLKSDVQLLKEIGDTEFEVNTTKKLLKDIPNDRQIVYCDFKNKGKELEGFTLEELGLDPKNYYFISPTNKKMKDVNRFKDLITWYYRDKSDSNNRWTFSTDGSSYVREALAHQLGISHMNGDTLEKTAGLLRIRREIVEQYPKLYEIVKEAITWASDDNQDTMRELVKAHIQEMKK